MKNIYNVGTLISDVTETIKNKEGQIKVLEDSIKEIDISPDKKRLANLNKIINYDMYQYCLFEIDNNY